MFDIQITLPNIEEEIKKRVLEANDLAVRAAANVAIGPVRAAIPIGKTGQMQQQTQIKYFQRQFGMIGASIKVIGPRHFVEHILEYGSRTHGGRRARGSRVRKGARMTSRLHSSDRGPIAARHTFGNVFRVIQSQIEATYLNEFSSNFNK